MNGSAKFTWIFDAIFFPRFRSKINEYERVIREVIPSSSRGRARQWLDQMYPDQMYPGEPMIDGQLAVIVSLAENIEHLIIDRVYLSSLPIA